MYDEKCLTCIGGNIRFLRMVCQISQQELARRIGISQTHLSNMERNHVNVSLKLLLRIANVLDCQLEVFLDTQAALDWGQEQAEKAEKAEKTVSEQESLTETYTLEEVRQLLQLLRRG
ncbi:MAG: helix-turn-helix domain-containing protein [Phascolarctobacterium sp.]|uniref:helix-turn-helix domain-containing protein n=1 Tax=Phascolarctobacterium sp. TaxID=2049039 RepID=UPI0025DB211E|nr:helix-turn-helix transcriptional regulator [Phascolarctobacterium sp.]MCC8158472.1 helix-turn-helix domain-containing protein [Phascolarctobacterium sp.]